MKRRGDKAHPCSTPTVNGRGLIPPTRTQMSEQEYNCLTASKWQNNAINNLQNVLQGTRAYAFSRLTKHV